MKTLGIIFNVIIALFAILSGVGLLFSLFTSDEKPKRVTDKNFDRFNDLKMAMDNWFEDRKTEIENVQIDVLKEWETDLVKKYGLKEVVIQFDEEQLRRAAEQ